jgi:hypothetical protein
MLTNSPQLAAFKDLDFKLEALLALPAYIVCPITGEPFEVSIDLSSKSNLTQIFSGVIVFNVSDLHNASLAYQTI